MGLTGRRDRGVKDCDCEQAGARSRLECKVSLELAEICEKILPQDDTATLKKLFLGCKLGKFCQAAVEQLVTHTMSRLKTMLFPGPASTLGHPRPNLHLYSR